jgi:O-antigen ligase
LLFLTAFAMRRTNLLLLTSAWTASGTALYIWAPLLSPGLQFVAPLLPLSWYFAKARRLPLARPTTVAIALAVTGVYLVINALWSKSASSAHLSLAVFFLTVLSFYVTVHTLDESDEDVLRSLAIGLYAGLLVGGMVMFFEVFSLQWIHRKLLTMIPTLRPKPRDMILDSNVVVYLESYLFNRNITAMTLLFWPTLLAVSQVAPTRQRQHWWLAGLVPVAAAILGSKHGTSKIAFVGSLVTFVALQIRPEATRRVIAWAWTGAILLVVPLANIAYHSQLYLADWIPYSARHRVVIWGHTSHLIAEAPILGSGINTARALNDPVGYDAPMAPGSNFRLTTGLHSHNVYLQAWYETGAFGALMMIALGLLVLRSLSQAPHQAQPFLYAIFATAALLGGTSFSLWQPWFIASFGFAAGFACLGWALAERHQAQGHRNADGARA